MSQRKNLHCMFGIAMLAMTFGASSSFAQSSQDASGMTRKSGPMGMSGQSDSSSAMSGGSAAGKPLSRSDQDLMRDIAHANLAEIEAGKLAQSKSKNDEVKNFAQRMIDDHTKAQQELQQLADAKGVKLPTEPDLKHQTELKALSAMSGDTFDKAYMKQGGLSDHRSAHQLVARVQGRASDPDLKALGDKMMPTINQHMSMAQGVKSSTESSGSSGASKGSSDTGK